MIASRRINKYWWVIVLVIVVGFVGWTVLQLANTTKRTNEIIASEPQDATENGFRPKGIPGAWNLAFSDEFEGTALDTTKWTPNWLAGSGVITKPINTAEASCYDPANVTVLSGELKLRAIKDECVANNGTTYDYRSGMVQTNDKFAYTYGVAEARMWLPEGAGVWPAFWSNGQNWPADGEIDTVEAYGDDSPEYHYHYEGCGASCGPGGKVHIEGATAGWHTYATKWEPGKITWYYDGKEVWRYTKSITDRPLYLIVNMGILGADFETGEKLSPQLPATLRVDYVRVWQADKTKK